MKKLILITTLAFGTAYASAQESSGYKAGNTFDLTGSAGSRQYSAALSWNHLHGVGKTKKFKIGYGLRFSSYYGKDQEYVTAPARLTSKKTDPTAIFSQTYEENLDTLTLPASQVYFLNAEIILQYSFSPNLELGFNIDAAGLSFGSTQSGVLKSTIQPNPPLSEQNAKPTQYNLLLVSDNDIGSLNSELYLRYWFKEKWAVKLGYTFLFAEYQTQSKVVLDNDRYRTKASMIGLGITYAPFK